MRPSTIFLCLSLAAAAAPLAPSVAFAEVSDAERAAARRLYTEGVELQKAGKNAEALDRFERAQQVFSAPTNLLRIAQCRAAVGMVVESAEAYRALINTPLPNPSPQAFTDAQEQAKRELPTVEPRIAKLRVDVSPKSSGATLQVDGRPVNAALFGQELPANAGDHKVSVVAPGFAPSEQTVTLKERESKTLSVVLTPMPGVSYAPGTPQPPPNNPPGGTEQPRPVPEPPPPAEKPPVPITTKSASNGILAGIRLGASIPAGTSSQGIVGVTNAGFGTSEFARTGFGFGFDFGFRFARSFLLQGTIEGASYSAGSNADALLVADQGEDVTTKTTGVLLGGTLAYVTNPDKTSFYGEIGAGYRWFSPSATLKARIGNQSKEVSRTFQGGELLLGLGISIPAAQWLKIIPKVNVGIGSYSKYEATCTGSSGERFQCSKDESVGAREINNSATHTFVFLGIGGYYSRDL